MNLRLFAHLGRALAACFVLTLSAAAQIPTLAPQPPLSKLVVQVVFQKGAQPAYLSVPGSAWYAAFGLTPAASARAAADTVQAVDVKARLEGDRVELKVGVHVGTRFFDRLDEGERAQLPRLLRLVGEAQETNGAETAEAVRKLRAGLAALDDAAPQASVDAVLAAHPGLPPRTAADGFKRWLGEQQARFEGWLARL